MSDTPDIQEAASALSPTNVSARSARLLAYFELTKPRIASLSLVATAMGFFLALPASASVSMIPLLIHTLVATAMVAAGANAINQFMEADLDAKMERTRNRPIPSGRLTPFEVGVFGLCLALFGVVYLALAVNTLAASIAAVTFCTYAFVYTPLKRVTSLCVFVGAIPGALPPVIGWAAASGSVTIGGWLLFAIVFFWQLPHFVAIAWLYQDDYRRAGYPMLPVIDQEGTRTNLHMITHTVGLIVVSLLPAMASIAGPTYAVSAMILGVAFLGVGIVFVVRKTRKIARLHLLASIIYLPCLLVIMTLDKV
ncbi:MAG: protoheme IX farnesyltransferase [Planctomycetes bacterium]|nr:protoheme IX farnesyltransferase [Planctomycetota bacterium]